MFLICSIRYCVACCHVCVCAGQIVGDPVRLGAIINCCHGLNKKKNCELSCKTRCMNGIHYRNAMASSQDKRIQVFDNFVTVASTARINGVGEREECLLYYGKGYWSAEMTVCQECLLSECSAQHLLLLCSLPDCTYVCHYLCMEVQHRHRYEANKRHWLCPSCYNSRTSAKPATLFRDAPTILYTHPREIPASMSIRSDVVEITPPVSPSEEEGSSEEEGCSDNEVDTQ
jgi:hypothetical protein